MLEARDAVARILPVACAALVCCRADPQDPEAQIRSLLSRSEAAASEKDLATVKDAISELYADDSGHDKQAIAALVGFNFLRNDSIHLLTRVLQIELLDPTHAEASVLVAMAGQPIPGGRELAKLRASIYRFDFSLCDEGSGGWRVTSARWQRARREDLF